MPLRPRKLPANYRGSGQGGNFARSLIGGMLTGGGGAVVPDTAAVADVASKTPFTDKTFDAGTVNRFKPASPFKNFMSGGAGTENASQLNVQAQLEESDALRQQNQAEFETELQKQYDVFARDLGLETDKTKQANKASGIGRNFRSFIAQNPDFKSGFNISPQLSDQAIGELLSAAVGENLGQGFIAGIPTANATGATQNNIATQQQGAAPFLPALTRALQTLNVNTAQAQAGGSGLPNFAPAVQEDQLEKLRATRINNDAASRFSVNPNQAVIGREGIHKGPIFQTVNKPQFQTMPDGTQIPAGIAKEEQMISDYNFSPFIPITPDKINPNPVVNPTSSQQPVAPFQQNQNRFQRRRRIGAGASGSY
jgi:hypothetical protein